MRVLQVFLASNRRMSQILPAKYFRDLKPYITVFTECNEKSVCEQRPQFKLRFSNNLNILEVEILFLNLFISIANKWILLWFVDTGQTFLSECSKDDWFSTESLRARPCKWSIQLFELFPQSIQISEQFSNCHLITFFIKVFRLLRDKKL